MKRHRLAVGLSAALLTGLPLTGPAAHADPGEPRVEPKANRVSRLRDPQGTVLIGASGGAYVLSGATFYTLGMHFGYAALTGVVPGIRGNFLFGDGSGGEVAGTVWLTPPLDLPVVPFGVGEVGYVWQGGSNGLLYGAGGGLHFGRPNRAFSVRAGVIYRVFEFDQRIEYLSPIVVGSFRL